MDDLGLTPIMVDGCQLGVTSEEGKPILKPWQIRTNSPGLLKALTGRKCPRDHEHQECAGKHTERSGYYPRKMCMICVKGFMTDYQVSRDAGQLAITKEEELSFGKLPKSEQERLMRVAAKIHTNTGHRNVEALAKQLRKMGAPLNSRAAMEKKDQCDSCKESGRNPPSPVVSLNTETKPWKTLGIDLKDHVDKDYRSKYLIMVDEAMKLVKVKRLYRIPVAQQQERDNKRGDGWPP